VKFRIRPVRPSGLSFSASYTSVKLTWEPVEDCDGYYIYRLDSLDGKYKQIGQAGRKLFPSYTDRNLKRSTEYSYRVVSYKKLENGTKLPSAYSEAVSPKTR